MPLYDKSLEELVRNHLYSQLDDSLDALAKAAATVIACRRKIAHAEYDGTSSAAEHVLPGALKEFRAALEQYQVDIAIQMTEQQAKLGLSESESDRIQDFVMQAFEDLWRDSAFSLASKEFDDDA